MSTNSEDVPLESPATILSSQCDLSQLFEQESKYGIYRAIQVRTDFITISSRIRSLEDWPHTKLPRSEVALAGFYHDPTEADPATVTCFSCGIAWPRTRPTGGRHLEKEVRTALLDFHLDNCIWADMLRDGLSFSDMSERLRTRTYDRQPVKYGNGCEITCDENSKVDISIRIHQTRKGSREVESLILDTMRRLLSQNCRLSFSYSNGSQ